MPALNEILSQARALIERGDRDGASALFKQVLESSPREPIALEYFGVQAVKSGDYEKAIMLFKQAEDHPRCRASVLFQLGHAYRHSGRLEDAAASYERYIGAENSPSGAVSLADVLFHLNRNQEAEKAAQQALVWQPDHVKALCLLARAHVALGREEDAMACRKKALESSDQCNEALLMKSCALLDLGETEQAFKAAGKVTNSLYGSPLEEAVEKYQEENYLSQLPRMQGSEPKTSDIPLVLATGDPKYVKIYGPDLIKSVHKYSPETAVHIHVISPDNLNTPFVFHDDLPPHTLSWECDPHAGHTTFATRRFVRLAEWRRTLDQTIVVLDIDSLVRNKISEALETLPKFDIAMRYHSEEIFILQRVAAGFLAVAPTHEARQFLNTVAAYILHFERAGTAKWFVDQMALLAARFRSLDVNGESKIRIVDIPEHFLDWQHHGAGSVVWTAKGTQKTLPTIE